MLVEFVSAPVEDIPAKIRFKKKKHNSVEFISKVILETQKKHSILSDKFSISVWLLSGFTLLGILSSVSGHSDMCYVHYSSVHTFRVPRKGQVQHAPASPRYFAQYFQPFCVDQIVGSST